MHRKVFAAIHVSAQRLDKREPTSPPSWPKTASTSAKFVEPSKLASGSPTQAAHRPRQLADAYKIDGVPAMGIHGRWFTRRARWPATAKARRSATSA